MSTVGPNFAYDVTKEKCIRVEDLDGDIQTFTLPEVINNADKIKRLRHVSPTPMDEFALFKLIQAFVVDIFKPDGIDGVLDLWEKGGFESAKVADYFDVCLKEGVCFDLFDKQRPFMQAFLEDFNGKYKTEPVSVLEPTWLSGNNSTFYGAPPQDGVVQDSYMMSPTEFLGSVVRNTIYPLFSGSGYSPGCLGGSGSAPVCMMLHGRSFYETLLLNMPEVFSSDYTNSIPYWKRNNHFFDLGIEAGTYLNYLFLPTAFIAAENVDENGCVKTVKKTGVPYEKDKKPQSVTAGLIMWDSCVLLRTDKTGKYFPVQSSRDRQPWMQLCSFDRGLLNCNGSFSAHLIEALADEELLDDDQTIPVSIYMLSIKGMGGGSYSSSVYNINTVAAFLSKQAQRAAYDYLKFVDFCRRQIWSCVKNYVEESRFYEVGADKQRSGDNFAEAASVRFMNMVRESFLDSFMEKFAHDGNSAMDAVNRQTFDMVLKIYDDHPVIRGNYLAKGHWRGVLAAKVKKEGGIDVEKE